MKLFANILIALIALFVSLSNAKEDVSFLYDRTKICTKHKSFLCLSYSKKHSMVVLGSRGKLDFEIETVERVNLKLNRVYTYAVDKATRTKVKSCLVRKELEDGTTGIDLAPCDTDERELVLAVEVPDLDFSQLTTDEFVLKEVSYLDDGNTVSSPYCISASTKAESGLAKVTTKKQLKSHTPIILTECGSDEEVYAQEFKAKNFRRSTSERFVIEKQVEIAAEIGMLCLTEKPDLCLGVSLTNGTDLEAEKLVQVKNLTKNEDKGIENLKMRWYRDLESNRIASASNMDYCLEAVYNAPIGENRAGRTQYDDVVHLGGCDPLGTFKTADDGRMAGLLKSELFYTAGVTTPTGSYMEIRTDVPITGTDSAEVETKCVSIVKCVKHDFDHCTPYNSFPVYSEVEFLQQGAYARLKDCNSEEMISQRFFYIGDSEVTVPPTKYPTPRPTEKEVTQAPVVTETPTPEPTFFVEPITPTAGDAGSTTTERSISTSSAPSLLIALAMVGVLCLLIILIALAYYVKHRGVFTGLPEEDENFIARV